MKNNILQKIMLWLTLTFSACGQSADQPVLRFSAIPDQDNTELKEKFDVWARYLSDQLDVTVAYVPARNYDAAVEMFRNGDIQLGWFGGLTGVQARRAAPGARAIAMGEQDARFRSYFIAHQDTGLTRSQVFPAAIAELSFTFGSKNSTSGRLMPAYFIEQETGGSADVFFQTPPNFQTSHDQTLEAVRSGAAQVGVLNASVYDKRLAQEPTLAQQASIIWVTPPYVDYNFTAHPDLDKTFGAGFTDRLQTVLLAVTNEHLLSAFPRKRLIAAKNEDFAQIRDVAIKLNLLREN